MSWRTFLASTVLLVVSLFGLARAQEKAGHPTRTGLVLEMALVKSIPPTYQIVSWPDSPNPGTFSELFERVVDWQLPPGAPRVLAVKVVPVLTGKVVTVQVSVYRGHLVGQLEEPVGTYRLRENESAVVKAAKSVGVEPFRIKVIRLSSLPTNPLGVENKLPSLWVENKLPSLEVVHVGQPMTTSLGLPYIEIIFRNLSQKTIEALSLQVMQRDQPPASEMRQGVRGKPLILPGETDRVGISLLTQEWRTAETYKTPVPSDLRVVITGVFFSDDTSEGSPPRELLLSQKFGHKLELRRLLPLLESALAPSDRDLDDRVRKLRQQVEALSYKLTKAEQAELKKTVGIKPELIEEASHQIRKDLLYFLQRYPNTMFEVSSGTWLVNTKDEYSSWLTRLETVAQTEQRQSTNRAITHFK